MAWYFRENWLTEFVYVDGSIYMFKIVVANRFCIVSALLLFGDSGKGTEKAYLWAHRKLNHDDDEN